PIVHFIVNKENEGFAKANNKALQYCNGDYILYLNPDTIICEESIKRCINFFENHDDCGGLGVHMIDGSGNFLPESKRSLPSPQAAFFKLMGLAKLFPRSKIFNHYALGHLAEYKNHEIDVLAGAFLMAKRTIIEVCKGFDEIFFMYGEDIDLSYRIQKLGYKNYYFSEITIIHFKGESLKKGSINHVKLFYGAMIIFVQKHYGKGSGKWMANTIQLAIHLRAIVSFGKRVVSKFTLQLIDAALIFLSLLSIKQYWIFFERDGRPFPQQSTLIIISSFTIIYLLAATLSGMYDKLYKPTKALLASITGIIVILAAYSLLPENQRFSRGVIVVGGFLAGLSVTAFRWILLKLKLIDNQTGNDKIKQTVVVGSVSEFEHVVTIFKQAGLQERIIGRISLMGDADAIGSLHQLYLLIISMKIKEVVFCEGNLFYHQIIQKIQTLPHNISYRFIGSNTSSIVGSDSKATTGETFTAEGFYQINQAYHKRMKRVVDMLIASIIIIGFPINLILIKNGAAAIKNALYVLFGGYSWVGYTTIEPSLPNIKPNIITCYGLPVNAVHPLNKKGLHQLNNLYAKNYDCWQDISMIFTNYRYLGGI
ncbi:MAG: glycosyltransferase, partial [Pedobacter sp.]|nr:glycosyltransferase [Chitinophagaceae bacterium]